jgi:hypothetical protein
VAANKKNPNTMKSIVKNLMVVAFSACLATTAFATPLGTELLVHTTDKSAPTVTTVTATATQYTCPMHPEVVKDAPGNCPKCEMKLVEKGAAKDQGKGCGSGCGKH